MLQLREADEQRNRCAKTSRTLACQHEWKYSQGEDHDAFAVFKSSAEAIVTVSRISGPGMPDETLQGYS